jgi:hypothetical protein
MLEQGNGETEIQVKKAADFVRRAFLDGNSLAKSVVLLPAVPRICLAAVVIGVRRAESGIFENQGAAIIEEDFLGTPCRALVELVGLRLGSEPALA